MHLRDVDYYYDQWSNCSTNELEATNAPSKRTRAMNRIQQSLIAAQELGDEKLQVVTQLQELIDQKTRQLDADLKNLDFASKDDPGLLDCSPKDTRSNSPTSYAPASATANYKSDSRGDELASTSLAAGPLPVGERLNSGSSSNPGSNSSSANNGDRNWKRSRRARNEMATSRSNSGNSLSNLPKASPMDALGEPGAAPLGPNKVSSSSGAGGGLQASASASSATQNKNKSGSNGNGKKRKRKSGRAQSFSGGQSSGAGGTQNARSHDDTPPLEETIDPDEPTYCLCDQISFGEMILCDNDLCPIEWFHFSCVSLTTKPKGKWFCPNCRGERPSVMKPKQQFLKELERYNREKEEKT